MNNEATPTESKPKHTELPWYLLDLDPVVKRQKIVVPFGPSTIRVAYIDSHDIGYGICENEYIANAEFIVRACNSHYALLEALKDVEWASNIGGGPCCPWCGGLEEPFIHGGITRMEAGHTPDCELAAAIAKAEPEGDGQ